MTRFRRCFYLLSYGVFLGGLWLVPGLPVAAQTAPQPVFAPAGQGYGSIVNSFFDLDKQMKYKEAADCLLNSNPAEADNPSLHETLFVSLDQIRQKVGDFKKFAPIIDKLLGKDIAYVYGIALHEKGAVRFEFIFAREDTGWELLTCSYSMNFTDDLRTLAGLPREPVSGGAK